MEAPSLAVGQVYRNVVRSPLRYHVRTLPDGFRMAFGGDDPELPPVIDVWVAALVPEVPGLVLVEAIGSIPARYYEEAARVLAGQFDSEAST